MIKFVEQKEEKGKVKGKSVFEIRREGIHEIYIQNELDKISQQESKRNSSGMSDNGSNNKKVKRMAYIEYEVHKTPSHSDNPKHHKPVAVEAERRAQDSENENYIFPISEETSRISEKRQNVFGPSQGEQEIMENLGQMRARLDQHLVEQRDENAMHARFLDEEGELIEEMIGGKGKKGMSAVQ